MDMVHFVVLRKLTYWDDLTGEPLDPDDVQKARRLEVE